MAETKDDVDIVDEGSGGKSKMMMIIIVVAVLAIAGVAYFFLAGGDAPKEGTAATKDVAPAPVKKQTPIYATIEKPLVVNFSAQSKNAVRYLSIKVKVMARDQATIDAFKLHMPAIQNDLLLLFFGQKYDDLNTTAGIKKLKTKTLETINNILKTEKQQGKINAVYFTSVIMQ